VVPAVAGLGSVALGIAAVRRRGPASGAYADLGTPFGVMALLFGGCGLLYAVLGLFAVLGGRLPVSMAGPTMGVVEFVLVVPWTVFALRYVGRGRLVTRRRVVVAVVVVVVLLTLDLLAFLDPLGLPDQQRRSVGVAASVLTLAVLAVVFAASWLVLATSSRHDRFTQLDGVVAVTPVVVPMLTFQITRPSTPVLNGLLTAGAFGGVVLAAWLGTTRYDLLTDRPGTGTLGERAAVTEMDEAVVVVDHRGRIARANPAATAVFGASDASARLRDVVGCDVETLMERETIECRTTSGRRQFDPRVTELRNGHGELLGHTLTLFDVTDREIRRQRLQVLNRILRHNLRNRLDVIRAHAEEASNARIVKSADRLDRLSTEARRIETLMERAGTTEASTHLPTVVDQVVTAVTEAHPTAETRINVPDVTLGVDPGLCRYALEQLVENAVEHNDGDTRRLEISGSETDTGTLLVVADDGPGIPETERDVITDGTEHDLAHGSSLGLWGANWAIKTLGGGLSFESSDLGGTAVVLEFPGSV
jgi:signal transduction histidine kinase